MKLIGSSYDKYPYTVTASVVFVGLVYSLKVLTVDTLQSTDGILFVFFFVTGRSQKIEKVYFEIKESLKDQWEKPQIKVNF